MNDATVQKNGGDESPNLTIPDGRTIFQGESNALSRLPKSQRGNHCDSEHREGDDRLALANTLNTRLNERSVPFLRTRRAAQLVRRPAHLVSGGLRAAFHADGHRSESP